MVRIALLVVGVAACATVESIEVDVKKSYEVSTVPGAHAGTGNMFVIVELEVHNNLDMPAPVSMNQYLLRTSGGSVMATPRTSTLGADCPLKPLDSGFTTACRVGFEIARTLEPDSLFYSTTVEGGLGPTPIELEKSLDFQHCGRCAEECFDFAIDASNCGGCGIKVPVGGKCVAGKPTCGAGRLCNGVCYDASNPPC
jgi:hypothetical protein